MKIKRLFTILITFVSLQTSFSQSSPTDSIIDILKGEWLWTETSGGYCWGDCFIKGDSSVKYIFKKSLYSSDSVEYQKYKNNILEDSGKAKVAKGWAGSNSWYLDGVSGWRMLFWFNDSENELTLHKVGFAGDDIAVADAPIEKYRRNLISTATQQAYSNYHVSVYPNPADGILNISALQQDCNVSIFSSEGVLVFTKDINGLEAQINVSSFKTGIYYLTVKNQKGVLDVSEKIIISR